MIPDHELGLLLDAAEAAVDAAEAGEYHRGHSVLIAGLLRSCRLVAVGKPWAVELRDRYTFALGRYSEAYSVLRHWQPPVEAVER